MRVINGNLKDIFGSAIDAAQLVIQLCRFGSEVPRVSGTALIANIAPIEVETDAAGAFTFNIFGNDVLTPQNTYYTVQVKNANGDVVMTNAYQFENAGAALDLSAVTPFDPETPAPPIAPVTVISGLVAVPYSANPVFDCSLVNGLITFDITLTGNVAGSTCINVAAGKLVTFIVKEDAVGGRTFAWPANVKNAGAIDTTTNAINVQQFIARADGNLYPVGPLTVN